MGIRPNRIGSYPEIIVSGGATGEYVVPHTRLTGATAKRTGGMPYAPTINSLQVSTVGIQTWERGAMVGQIDIGSASGEWDAGSVSKAVGMVIPPSPTVEDWLCEIHYGIATSGAVTAQPYVLMGFLDHAQAFTPAAAAAETTLKIQHTTIITPSNGYGQVTFIERQRVNNAGRRIFLGAFIANQTTQNNILAELRASLQFRRWAADVDHYDPTLL